MEGGATAAVLFADVIGGARLYESAGDAAAARAIAGCVAALREATLAAGGEVVKTVGEEIMATFPNPDAAAAAATRMHIAVDALPPVGETRLALRVGFHAGPVLRRDGDVFGDTVNLASRLAGQASRGQILTSRQTSEQLSAALRNCTRVLYDVELKGKSDSVALCELVWRQSPDVTDLAGGTAAVAAAAASRLRLRYRGRELAEADAVLRIGRDRDCELVIEDEHVSRRHCTVERRREKYVVQDHSANGTYVTVEGEDEIVLRREDFVLRGHGWIAFGQPRAATAEVIEYFCE